MTNKLQQAHERDLQQLTSLPTAAGREDRVIAWVKRWASRRKSITIKQDKHGNLLLRRADRTSRKPIYFTAHMDHPAFVVKRVDGNSIEAEFRGGVNDDYFKGTSVRLWHGKKPPQIGQVSELLDAGQIESPIIAGCKTARITFKKPPTAEPGDVITWDLPTACIRKGQLHAPACDDLAPLASAIAAFGQLTKSKTCPDIRLLLTRAEEIGFIGAIAACSSGLITKNARLIALEASKSFPESPIGAGPIVRVGDLTSTFDPGLTYAVSQVAANLTKQDPAFRWQRKLMPGGTCEASAYQALGYTATCVCLPLGNYHNMNQATGRIASEYISINDFHQLTQLLVGIARQLDDPSQAPPLVARLQSLFENRKQVFNS